MLLRVLIDRLRKLTTAKAVGCEGVPSDVEPDMVGEWDLAVAPLGIHFRQKVHSTRDSFVQEMCHVLPCTDRDKFGGVLD
jgi:hypothetical protein